MKMMILRLIMSTGLTAIISLRLVVSVQVQQPPISPKSLPTASPPRSLNVPPTLKPSHASGYEASDPRLSANRLPQHIEEDEGIDARYAAEFSVAEWRAQYWADPRVHGFGNSGSLSAVLHAFVAPFFTLILDLFAYDGKDVRRESWQFIKRARAANLGAPRVSSAVDLGCGTGFTARSIARAFFSRGKGNTKSNVGVIALDTSPEMLKVGKDLTFITDDGTVNGVHFIEANAEDTRLSSASFDLVVASFLFHECPREARHRILEEGLRILAPGGTLAVLDIHTHYQPSDFMLTGEPYLNGYLDHFETDAADFATRHAHHFASAHRDVIVPGRLVLWHFHAKPSTPPRYLNVLQ